MLSFVSVTVKPDHTSGRLHKLLLLPHLAQEDIHGSTPFF